MSVEWTPHEIKKWLRLPDDFPEELLPRHRREIAFLTVRPDADRGTHPLGEVISQVTLFAGDATRRLLFLRTPDGFAYEEVECG